MITRMGIPFTQEHLEMVYIIIILLMEDIHRMHWGLLVDWHGYIIQLLMAPRPHFDATEESIIDVSILKGVMMPVNTMTVCQVIETLVRILQAMERMMNGNVADVDDV